MKELFLICFIISTLSGAYFHLQLMGYLKERHRLSIWSCRWIFHSEWFYEEGQLFYKKLMINMLVTVFLLIFYQILQWRLHFWLKTCSRTLLDCEFFKMTKKVLSILGFIVGVISISTSLLMIIQFEFGFSRVVYPQLWTMFLSHMLLLVEARLGRK